MRALAAGRFGSGVVPDVETAATGILPAAAAFVLNCLLSTFRAEGRAAVAGHHAAFGRAFVALVLDAVAFNLAGR